jgi:hypothetical protein
MKSTYGTSNVHIIFLPANLINSSAYHAYEKIELLIIACNERTGKATILMKVW